MSVADQIAVLEDAEQRAAAVRLTQIWAFFAEERRDADRAHKVEEDQQRRDAEAAEVLASVEQLAAMHERLDRYDAAVVHALMDNRRAMDQADDRLKAIKADAYTLSDGRRVYKSEDGQQVFDDSGAAIGRDVIDPDLIDARKPTIEAFTGAASNRQRLEQEREGLLAYQARVDKARERIDRDGVSKGELEAIDQDLRMAMPDAMKARLPAVEGDPAVRAGSDAPVLLGKTREAPLQNRVMP